MSVSEIFDADAWRPVAGFDDLTDVTYHRAVDHGTVRIAFDRPEVRNAFRPGTVDELLRTLDHARMSSDVGCVLLTGNDQTVAARPWREIETEDHNLKGWVQGDFLQLLQATP